MDLKLHKFQQLHHFEQKEFTSYKLGIMNNVTRIVILSICAVLTLNSCRWREHQPVEPPKIPLEFTAMSQTAMLKSGASKAITPLSGIHGDFGVWGIARQEGNNTPYVLWESDAMCQVVKSNDNSYVPVNAAYWLADFRYNFIAVAPYESVDSDVTVDETNHSISFECDLGAKYGTGDYAFDLMGAVAEKYVDPAVARPTSQDLTFWHLFSQICINVIFEEADKTPITGTVDAIRLSNVVTKADYEISFGNDKNLDVVCEPSTLPSDKITSSAPLVFNQSNKDKGTGSKWTIHIFPQIVSGFVMYIDFTIGETSTRNFKVNLSAAGNNAYDYNGAYNWNIRITPKTVSFDVSVKPWVEDNNGNNEFDFE